MLIIMFMEVEATGIFTIIIRWRATFSGEQYLKEDKLHQSAELYAAVLKFKAIAVL